MVYTENCNCKKILVIDESFADFAEEKDRFSLINNDILTSYPHVVVLKSYGIPGCRLGVLASGDTTLVRQIASALPIWNINSFGEYFLQIIGKYSQDYKTSCARIAANRYLMYRALSYIDDITPYPSWANYIMCGLKGTQKARALATELLDNYNILLKVLSGREGLPNGEYIRLTVRTEEENSTFVKVLAQYLINKNKQD